MCLVIPEKQQVEQGRSQYPQHRQEGSSHNPSNLRLVNHRSESLSSPNNSHHRRHSGKMWLVSNRRHQEDSRDRVCEKGR